MQKTWKTAVKRFMRLIYAPASLALSALGIRFMRSGFHTRIGHQILEPFIAFEMLREQTLSARRVVVLEGPKPGANCLVLRGIPKPFVVIRNGAMCRLLEPFTWFEGITVPTGEPVAGMNSEATVFSRADELAETPLFSCLRNPARNALWSIIESALGIDPGSPIVGVHVRERGYSLVDDDLHDYRNADLGAIYPAVRWLNDQGYSVVRLGGNYSPAVDPSEPIIDYAHSDVKSDEADVAIIQACEFFVGNTSGLHCLAGMFDRPVLGLNMTPMGAFGLAARVSLAVPKTYADEETGAPITFWELGERGLVDARFSHQFEQAGVTAVENNDQDILAAVREIASLSRGEEIFSGTTIQLEERFRQALTPQSAARNSLTRLSPSFLLRYAALIDPDLVRSSRDS
jgi:putative glycosyltransferase (TIGR04372 family)